MIPLTLAITILCADPGPNSEAVLADAMQTYQRAMATAERDERVNQFRRAEMLFSQVIETNNGVVGPDLFVNLGNASLESTRIGPAVWAYRQALNVDPTNQRALSNLAYARSLIPTWVRDNQSAGIVDNIFFWNQFLSTSRIALIASFCFLLTATLIGAAIVWEKNFLRPIALLPAAIWLALIFSVLVGRWKASDQEGVVVTEEVVARSADSMTSAARFADPLPGGTEVKILERRADWSRVRIGTDPSPAWIPSSSVRPIGDLAQASALPNSVSAKN